MWEHVSVCVVGVMVVWNAAVLWVKSRHPVLVLKVQWFLHLVSNNGDSVARWGKRWEDGWAAALKWNIRPHFLWFLLCRTRSAFIIYLRKEIYFCGCCLCYWLITAGWGCLPPFSPPSFVVDPGSTLLQVTAMVGRLLIHPSRQSWSIQVNLIRFGLPVLRSQPGFWPPVAHAHHHYRLSIIKASSDYSHQITHQPPVIAGPASLNWC